jgi:8-oxo-dGTP pyrophosphatase MutT (NUDIX family)
MADPWLLQGTELVHDAGIFRLNQDHYHYLGKSTHPYYVLEAPDWVNIIALTPAGEVVLVRQYRHGVRQSSLEIPGGMIDPVDSGPAAAAARELAEETGYRGAELEPLLVVTSNPAILSNRTHSFVTRDAIAVSDPHPDEHEDVEVVLEPLDRIPGMIASGEIHHSLSVAALATFLFRRDA